MHIEGLLPGGSSGCCGCCRFCRRGRVDTDVRADLLGTMIRRPVQDADPMRWTWPEIRDSGVRQHRRCYTKETFRWRVMSWEWVGTIYSGAFCAWYWLVLLDMRPGLLEMGLILGNLAKSVRACYNTIGPRRIGPKENFLKASRTLPSISIPWEHGDGVH
jgi:hypothetical protein